MTLLSLIADAAPASPDPQISGAWLLAAIAKVGSVLVALAGAVFGTHKFTKRQMERQHSSITIKPPIPTINVENSNPPHPSWDQHIALVARVDGLVEHQDKMRSEQTRQYIHLLETGAARERSIFEKIDAVANGLYDRINTIADNLRKNGPKT